MVNWIETTEERHDEMLGAVPPAARNSGAFLMGEPYSQRDGQPTFHAFKYENGKYYASSEPITFKEFQIERPTARYYGC